MDLLLILVAVLSLIESDLNGNQVWFHSVDHVLVRSLNHHLVLMGALNAIQPVLGVVQAMRLRIDVVLNGAFLIFGLL